ncbi:MAG TPA: GNAT family N-acetyltransferase [Alphaproteobacteria bacterium]
MTNDMILKDLPMPIRTPRLVIRPPEPGMGAALHEAIQESLPELRVWMGWADKMKTVEDSEIWVRKKAADFMLREDFVLLVFDHHDRLLGSTGFHHKTDLPLLEIGYWIRTSEMGKGYVTEWANALTRYAFEIFGVKKLRIDANSNNERSMAVAERLGFELEYAAKWDILKPNATDMQIRNVYSRFDIDNLPPLDVNW